jgi:hypothetical protein
MTAADDERPTCIVDGCDRDRYHGFERCHRHHRERMLDLPPGVVPSR